ncbi:hypothetical protein IAT38_005969 [Cryptococcus sp. DSM 104549]
MSLFNSHTQPHHSHLPRITTTHPTPRPTASPTALSPASPTTHGNSPASPSSGPSLLSKHRPPSYTRPHPHQGHHPPTIPSSSARPHPLKRLSIDLSDQSYSHSTSTEAYTPITPTQENGHVGITRRRPSLSLASSSPRRQNSQDQAHPHAHGHSHGHGHSRVRSPTGSSYGSVSSGFGWLTGSKLTLPPGDSKASKSDDEREEDDTETDGDGDGHDDQKRYRTHAQAHGHAKKYSGGHKWDWMMGAKNAEASGSTSSGAGAVVGPSTTTPAIGVTPVADPPLIAAPYPVAGFSPPRQPILPSQAPLGAASGMGGGGLQPLPQDPHNILPLSLPSTPFTTPPISRVPSPQHSPHPSIPDFSPIMPNASHPATHGAHASGPSGSGSSPRTSISTSSSRIGWAAGRSDSRSSADDDDLPPLGLGNPIPHGWHRSVSWWHRADSTSPVSPKITVSGPNTSGAPRIMRLGSATAGRLIPTGTRRWGWLFEMVGDLFQGMGGGGGEGSPRKGGAGKRGARERERERLMGGGGGRQRRRGDKKVLGSKWLARVMVFVPTEPWSISLFLIFLAAFAVTLTFTIKHILNPDKEPLPWREYCTTTYPTLYSLQDPSAPAPSVPLDFSAPPKPIPTNSFAPPSSKLALTPLTPAHPAWPYRPHAHQPFTAESSQEELDAGLEPVGVLVGVFTTDAGVERRHMIRQSYASHWRSRREGTEGVRVRFVMGRPRKAYAKAVQLEMEAFNDILLLDMEENMNSGKTHAFFSWAAANATVPDWEYPLHPRDHAGSTDGTGEADRFPDGNVDVPFPNEMTEQDAEGEGVETGEFKRAPSSSAKTTEAKLGGMGSSPVWRGEKRPAYVVKADEDSFIMLGELEKRLRVAPRSKAFWGYLVKNTFMAGECYALSFDLVQYIAASPALRTLTRGKEDKLVAKWMNMHPEREEIVWMTERCWIYDHPKAGTVYSHGFLYPSTVSQVRLENSTGLPPTILTQRGGPDAAPAFSSVTKFGVAYRPFADDMSATEQVEALVEGSPLSRLRDADIASDGGVGGGERPTSPQQTFSRAESVRLKISRLFASRPSRAERFNNDPLERGGTVVVHYIKKAEWFVETMVAMLGGADEQGGWHRGVGTGLGALERRKGRVVGEGGEGAGLG